MRISELASTLDLESMHSDFEDTSISSGYTSDLLSDVMAKAGENNVLVTIQAHKNTVAVASLVNIAGIIICNNRPIPEEMVASAREEGIALFRSPQNQFEISGRLYTALGNA